MATLSRLRNAKFLTVVGAVPTGVPTSCTDGQDKSTLTICTCALFCDVCAMQGETCSVLCAAAGASAPRHHPIKPTSRVFIQQSIRGVVCPGTEYTNRQNVRSASLPYPYHTVFVLNPFARR